MKHYLRIIACLAAVALMWSSAAIGQAPPDGLQIRLKAAEFDPIVKIPRFSAALTAPPPMPGESRRYLVQFYGPLTEDDQLWVQRQGGQIAGYIPDYTLIVKASYESIGRLGSEGRARWIGLFEPAYKIIPDIGRRTFADSQRQREAEAGIHTFIIGLFSSEDPVGAAAAIESLGARVLDSVWAGDHWNLEVKATRRLINRLAQLEAAQSIEEAGEAVLRNDITKWVIQSNVSGQTPIWDKGLKGENQIIGIIDTAIYKAHMVFNDPSNGNVPGPDHRKLVSYRSSQGQNAGDLHGTHTGGTAAGDHEPIDGSAYRNGMAPHARLAFYYLGDISYANLYSRFTTLYGDGARVFTNSWGDDGTRNYTAWSRDIDRFSWDNETALVNFAVSNGSRVTTPENAKDCIGAGATAQAPSQESWCLGGSGPTLDGRRKPELYAPGCDIWSARSGTSNQWTSLSGTSMSCPAITGAAALVRQYYLEGWYPSGIKTDINSFDPSGALVKATLLNAGADMTGVGGYPSDREGWGRLLLDNALFFSGEGRRLVVYDQRNAAGLATGESKRIVIRVLDSGQPLKITMVYTDYPAEVNANPATVNDVDLNVLTLAGGVYRGNNINTSTGESNQFGNNDPKNNVEMVILKQPPPGIYIIEVSARAVNQGVKQGFAVVATGNIKLVTPGGP